MKETSLDGNGSNWMAPRAASPVSHQDGEGIKKRSLLMDLSRTVANKRMTEQDSIRATEKEPLPPWKAGEKSKRPIISVPKT